MDLIKKPVIVDSDFDNWKSILQLPNPVILLTSKKDIPETDMIERINGLTHQAYIMTNPSTDYIRPENKTLARMI